jgi:hypothetical protein
MKGGAECVALRLTEHTRPQITATGVLAQWNGARYEWFLQSDGSMDFSKNNVAHGSGEVFEKGNGTEDNLFIQAGSLRFEWSLSDWIYFPYDSDTQVSMAPTEWVRLEDVDAAAKFLHWMADDTEIVWGKAVNGLQLGVRLDTDKRAYHTGDTLSFTLTLRNVGKAPIQLGYYKPDWGIVPKVADMKGKSVLVLSPAVDGPVQQVSKTLAPGKRFKLSKLQLKIGPPDRDSMNPALDAAPGKYRFTFPYGFAGDKPGTWAGELESGQVEIEVEAQP